MSPRVAETLIRAPRIGFRNGFPMLERVDRTYTKDEVMSMMEPLISTWFEERFDDLTIPQAKAIPVIHQRRSVLVSSPTGSG